MQKKLIALAVAGLASSAAFAQTNVTMYGVADGTLDYVWTSGRDVRTATVGNYREVIGTDVYTGTFGGTTHQSQDLDGNFRASANSSYLGFKGSEDLGNGLKAIFQYELGFDFTNGSSLGGARDSFVGLSSANMGTVVLGNLTGPTRALGAALDVNPGATGIGANSGMIGKIGGGVLKSGASYTRSVSTTTGVNPTTFVNETASATSGCARDTTCTSLFDTRWANAIAYLSPNWGGFSFALAGVANEGKSPDYGTTYSTTAYTNSLNGVQLPGLAGAGSTSTSTIYNPLVAQQPSNVYGFDTGVKWEGGGFMVGLTYNWAQFGDILDQKVDNLRLGAMYTGAWWSVRGLIEQTNWSGDNTPVFNDNDQLKYGLGGTMTFGKTTLLAQWYGANDSDVNDSGANMYEVGALYSLSKRTSLKATWAMIDNDDNAYFDFGINSAGGLNRTATVNRSTETRTGYSDVSNTTVVGSTGAGSRVQGIQIGVRHSF